MYPVEEAWREVRAGALAPLGCFYSGLLENHTALSRSDTFAMLHCAVNPAWAGVVLAVCLGHSPSVEDPRNSVL